MTSTTAYRIALAACILHGVMSAALAAGAAFLLIAG